MEGVEVWAICPRCEAKNLVVIVDSDAKALSCSQCGSALLNYEPVRGYVYVLSNGQMPGLVKIGFTLRSVDDRIAELNSGTAVPAPFIIEGIFPSRDPERDELRAHQELAATRLPGREFFKATVANAVQVLARVCGEPAKYLRDASHTVRPRTPKEDLATPEEATERLGKWREKAWRR